ncbi:sensor histidine kinase [Aestuariivivens marinum]|uniref:sensor histidine kinase n=1 Tax=Aestuariivivens marinum TaxID=2913555 RepID=UPI001F5AA7B4|nr:sensor histidine kinase [Aestuariivivens marinum]
MSKLFKFNRKSIVHTIVLIVSIFSLYVSAHGALNRHGNLFNGSFYDSLLFVFTIYFIALIIIPLLLKNWKKYLHIPILYITIYSLLLGWIRAVQRSNSVLLRKGFSVEPMEYFTFDSVFKLSMTLIPMGIMALLYSIFVMDWGKLKKGFFQKNTEKTINSIAVILIMLYFSIMPAKPKTDAFFFVSFFILFFYINTFYISPILFIYNKKLKYIIITILWFGTLNAIYFLILYFFSGPMGKSIVTRNALSISFILRATFMAYIPLFLVSLTYGYIRVKIKNQDNILEAKESELSLLKSQVNPHFLFNTLNTLYSTALEEKAEKTAQSTAKLANLIRYMQEDINKDFIPLESEVKYLKDYINIQELRCAIAPQIETEFSNIENHTISPGLLIPFVENAFKYGIDPSKPSTLKVSVVCNENTINFECINSYNDAFKTYYKEQGFGIGIKNAKQRLELVYPKKHTFSINKTDHLFSVNMSINTK